MNVKVVEVVFNAVEVKLVGACFVFAGAVTRVDRVVSLWRIPVLVQKVLGWSVVVVHDDQREVWYGVTPVCVPHEAELVRERPLDQIGKRRLADPGRAVVVHVDRVVAVWVIADKIEPGDGGDRRPKRVARHHDFVVLPTVAGHLGERGHHLSLDRFVRMVEPWVNLDTSGGRCFGPAQWEIEVGAAKRVKVCDPVLQVFGPAEDNEHGVGSVIDRDESVSVGGLVRQNGYRFNVRHRFRLAVRAGPPVTRKEARRRRQEVFPSTRQSCAMQQTTTNKHYPSGG
jgi:hypothetical protein